MPMDDRSGRKGIDGKESEGKSVRSLAMCRFRCRLHRNSYVDRKIDTQRTYDGHVLDISWIYDRHILGM